MTKNHKPY